jgi:hypothetical protein
MFIRFTLAGSSNSVNFSANPATFYPYLSVACPVCNSSINVNCQTSSGKWLRGTCHKKRRQLVFPPSKTDRNPIGGFSMIPDHVHVIAVSSKGRSRIGKNLTTAIVEQRDCDKIFIVWPGLNQCRWIKVENDPDYRVIPTD